MLRSSDPDASPDARIVPVTRAILKQHCGRATPKPALSRGMREELGLYPARKRTTLPMPRMKHRPSLVLLLLCCLLSALAGCNRVHYPINLNTASAEDLAELPDIGPKLADAIIAGRPYKAVDEVVKVKGIGPKTLEKMRDKVTVGEQPATAPTK